MISFDEIFPFIVAIFIAIVLFFGFITVVKKSLKSPPKKNTIDSTIRIKEQKWRMDDVRQRQKQLMRDQRQKLRDAQRR